MRLGFGPLLIHGRLSEADAAPKVKNPRRSKEELMWVIPLEARYDADSSSEGRIVLRVEMYERGDYKAADLGVQYNYAILSDTFLDR
jgi:hypothetical protein